MMVIIEKKKLNFRNFLKNYGSLISQIFSQNNSLKGFTMIEMLVSIGIIAILAATFLANYHGAKKTGELNMAVQKLVSDIHLTQNYALGLKNFEGSPPAGGWGIRFREGSNEYIVFADKDASGKYRIGEEGTADNEKFKTVQLPPGITIKDLDIDGDATKKYLYLIYISPNANARINGAQNENNDNLIILDANISKVIIGNDINTKDIIINKFGLVDVD